MDTVDQLQKDLYDAAHEASNKIGDIIESQINDNEKARDRFVNTLGCIAALSTNMHQILQCVEQSGGLPKDTIDTFKEMNGQFTLTLQAELVKSAGGDYAKAEDGEIQVYTPPETKH